MYFLRTFFLLGIIFSVHSQVKVADIKGDFGEIKQAFNAQDNATGNFAIFLEDNNWVYAILYNRQFQEIGRVSAPDLSSKFKSVLGYQIDNKKFSLLMNTRNGRSYGVVQFDFETGKGVSKELDFKIRGESLIDAVSYQNEVYLLTIPNFSSQVNIYNFKDMSTPILTKLKFGENDFLDRRERSTRIYDVVEKSEISTVDIKVPNPLEITSKEFKLYQDGKKIILTADKFSEFTYVITIDLETFEKNVKRISKPEFEGFKMGIHSNSFWHNGKLFQIAANLDYLKFQLVDIETQKIIKKYELTDEDELFFKNTPIILEGGDFQAYRELEKTKQFLRKIAEGDVGLSVYKENSEFQITMGATSPKENGYLIVGGAIGGIAGTLIVASINSISNSYSAYGNTKSVRITGLFDENMDHLEGNIPANPFDNLKTVYSDKPQSQSEKFTIQAETVFKLGESYIRGFYNNKEEIYSLYKF